MKTENILKFLAELKDNNKRDWMEKNKQFYEEVKKDFETLIKYLIEELGKFDKDIIGLTPKDCIFRLNRDIRFSADKSPYKLNFGASMQKGGKKSGTGGYYIHIQPSGESFVGGGVYMPPSDVLAKIRQEIDYNGATFTKIIDNKDFKKTFGEVWGEKVKSAPKGYAKDHPHIELLKLKSFVAFQQFSDKDVTSDDFKKRVMEIFQEMKPFNDFLNTAIA